MKIEAIIFDWSGTLVDDLPAVHQATNYVFSQAGVPQITLDEFRDEFELPFIDFYRRRVPNVGLEKLEHWFHSSLRSANDSVAPLPHAADFLATCRHHNIKTYVLTATKDEHFHIQATRLGLHGFFHRCYTGVWDKREKIHAILSENNLALDTTLYVGDMEHDVETAKEGGIYSAAVLTGYNRYHQLKTASPDFLVEDLRELRTQIQLGLSSPASETVNGPLPPYRPIATVGALIADAQQRLLMIRTHKWSDKWGIPGGKIDYGESAESALLREIEEETTLRVKEVEFIMVQDCIESNEFYRKEHFLLLNYLCHVDGANGVSLNHEAQEFRWVSQSELRDLPLNRPTQILIQEVLKKGLLSQWTQ